MPSGQHVMQNRTYMYESNNQAYDANGDESAASILQSVKEQEAQFEQLTRELEVERQSVANQLERCKLGSETASMSSISSTDESFHWRGPQTHDSHLEESDTDSKLSGSHLVDSCLRVLQERGIMNVGEDPMDHMAMDNSQNPPPIPPPSSEHYVANQTYSSFNGPSHLYENTYSPNNSFMSDRMEPPARPARNVTTVTKVVTTRQVHRIGSTDSPVQPDQRPDAYDNYASYSSLRNQGAPPIDQQQGPPTPTRNNRYDDSYDAPEPPPPPGRYDDIPPIDDDRYNRYANMPPVDDRYGDMQDPRNGPEISVNNLSISNPPDDRYANHRYDDGDRFVAQPDEQYPPMDNGRYAPQTADNRYGNQPDVGNYSNLPDESFGSRPPPEDPYGIRPEDPYSTRPSERPGPDDSFSNPQDDRYGNSPYVDDRFRNSPSPAAGSDRYVGPPGYGDMSPYNTAPHSPGRYDDGNQPRLYDDAPRAAPYDDVHNESQPTLGAPPLEYDPDMHRRSPSIDSQGRGRAPDQDGEMHWRNPDLPEVIEFLGHDSNAIKANAAAYLQHLCYMDDGVKAKARALNAIPSLISLVNNDIPEVHRSACGALRNLSYGRANDENKREIKNAGGIPALVRLLRKSPDNDVRELVTGILWNLSSCPDLKRPIIDDGLTVITNTVVIPHSGWDPNADPEDDNKPRDVYWSTVFRNASGVLRNVSSDGEYSRRKLRECEGLVDALLHIVWAAIGKNDIDNKSVENCVCILRNLCYACQEVSDPNYHKIRQQKAAQDTKGETTSCFGGNKKKKDPQKIEQRNSGRQFDPNRPRTEPVRGMEKLWQPDVVRVYLPLLTDCSNPETLEAAAGAIQNLAACDWMPSVDIRAAVRKQKGLPIIVELLTIEADRVVCAAATALRNLAIDTRNKELVGKYAVRQLVAILPSDRSPNAPGASDDTISAVLATLYEVIKDNSMFARTFTDEEGVQRLLHITQSKGKFSPKVVKFASTVLYTMWQFGELHSEYKKRGWKEAHFVTKTMAAKSASGKYQPASANNTLNRPRADLAGHRYDDKTLPPINRQENRMDMNNIHAMNERTPTQTPDRDRYGGREDNRLRPEEIPMNEMSSTAYDMNSPGYATVDGRGGRDPREQEYNNQQHNYRIPVGGVPLFPNMHPPPNAAGQQQPDLREPLYAQVNKQGKRRHDNPHSPQGVTIDGVPEGGADSWV